MSLLQLAKLFPDEKAARTWFGANVWPGGRACPRCGYGETVEASHEKTPYWCGACRSYFSVRTGTLLESSRLSLLKWLYAFYLYATGLKGVSSLKLHCGIDVSQKTAWFVEGSALPEDEARDFATDQ